MLACNNIAGAIATPAIEKEIVSFTSTGVEYITGFTGTGTHSGEFRFYVGGDCYYVYKTSPGNRTAYIADRAFKVPAGVVVSLRVVHDDVGVQTFKGTILGGK